jgi:micrococcal nuclease
MKIYIILFLVIFQSNLNAQKFALNTDYKARIITVHDADSYEIGVNDTIVWVRLLGIDAPEVEWPQMGVKEQPHARSATNYVRDYLKSGDVKINLSHYDVFGRSVCRVTVNGLDLSRTLLYEGHAWYLKDKHLTWSERRGHNVMLREAKKNKRGIWALSNPINPAKWRKLK